MKTEKVNLSTPDGKFLKQIDVPRVGSNENLPRIIIHEGKFYVYRSIDYIETEPFNTDNSDGKEKLH